MKKIICLTAMCAVLVMSGCGESSTPEKKFDGSKGEVTLLTLDPGHFHAALVMISKYQERFPGKGMIEILSFVALNVCMSNITLNRQMKNLNDGEAALVKELEGYLENIDKNSR